MPFIIADSISYLPPIPPSPELKKLLTDSHSTAPWESTSFSASQRNLSVLFSNQSFFSAITPHYFQRAKVTKADLHLVMKLCPTFCFFDTLLLAGPEFRTKDVEEALANIICLRSLQLSKTWVNDSVIPRLLGTTSLHEFRFSPSATQRFGWHRPGTSNPQDDQDEESGRLTNISIWGLLKLLNHRDAKMRSSVAEVIAKVAPDRAYIQDETTIDRFVKLQSRREARKNGHFVKTSTLSKNNNNDAAAPTSVASTDHVGDAADVAVVEETETKKKHQQLRFELPWSDDDEAADDAVLPPIDYAEGIEDQNDDVRSLQVLGVLREILRKLRIRFSKEAGCETETFKNYLALASSINYDVCREIIMKVRHEDMQLLVKRSDEVRVLKTKLEELRRTRDSERLKLELEKKAAQLRLKQKSKTILPQQNKKNSITRTKLNENRGDNVGMLPSLLTLIESELDDNDDKNNNDSSNVDQDAASETQGNNAVNDNNITDEKSIPEENDEDEALEEPLPSEIAMRNAEEQISNIQNDFTIPTSVSHDQLIRRCSWIFEHIEDCMDSRNTKISEIGYDAARHASEHFPITFIINCFPQIYDKAAEAFPPQTPLPYTETERKKYEKSIRGRLALRKFEEKFAETRVAQQKYVYDPLRIKHASQVIAATFFRAQSMYPAARAPGGAIIPLQQATLMFVVRYFFKKVSLEKFVSLLIEKDVYVHEFTSRLKHEAEDSSLPSLFSIQNEKMALQETWELSGANNNNKNLPFSSSFLYEDSATNTTGSNCSSSVVAAALESLVGSVNKTTFDPAEYQAWDFFASFPEPLSTTTKSVISDIVRLYAPFCMADCVTTHWFAHSIVHLIGSCSSPVDVKTKAIELVRDSLSREYTGISVRHIVAKFENTALVEAVCAVFRRLNPELDPVTWYQAQLFVCIAADCLSLMATNDTIDEMRLVNEKCIFLRDDLPDGPGYADVATREQLFQSNQTEIRNLLDKAIELGKAVAESNFTHPTTTVPAAAIQLQREATNTRMTSAKKAYETVEAERASFRRMVAAAAHRHVVAPLVCGRQESSTLVILRSVRDSREVFEKVLPLVYPELRERTFNPVYLPLLRPVKEEMLQQTTRVSMTMPKRPVYDQPYQYVFPIQNATENDDEGDEKNSRRRQREQEEEKPKTKQTTSKVSSSSSSSSAGGKKSSTKESVRSKPLPKKAPATRQTKRTAVAKKVDNNKKKATKKSTASAATNKKKKPSTATKTVKKQKKPVPPKTTATSTTTKKKQIAKKKK